MARLTWLTEEEVDRSVSLDAAITRIADVIEREARGQARNVPKAMTTWDLSSAAHALGAYDEVTQRVAFKTWVNTPIGASALLTLFDSSNGKALAVLEAVTLGVIRTAAVTGLATRLMSDPSADELALIGTGRQALRQVAAVKAVRPLQRVRIWSPRAESREAFAKAVEVEFQIEATPAPTLEAAVADAPIVTLVTRAKVPFFPRDLLAKGAHLNAMGAILPANAEFDPALLADSDLTAVDSIVNAKRSSREFGEYFGDDWSSVVTLGDLLIGSASRPESPRMTVFKGLGMGLSDLAAATLAVETSVPETGEIAR